MKVKHYSKGKFGDGDENMFMWLERECVCFCFCMNRPEMIVNINYPDDEGKGRKPATRIGRIEWPFLCCSIGLNIYDKDNKLKFKIAGECCQAGIICKGYPCKSCQEVFLNIYDANGNELTPLTKWSKGCLKSAISDADNFSVVFPQNSTPEDKALIFSSVLMLDYCYFEDKGNQQNRNQAY